jgi:hypothetical protein
MRLDNGEHALEEVGLHLTIDEARRTIEVLTDLIEEVAQMGFEATHGGLSDGEFDLTLFVSKDAIVQASDFEGRLKS